MTFHNFREKLKQGHKYEVLLDEHFAAHFDIAHVGMDEERRGIDRIFTNKATGKRLTIQHKADERASQTGNAFVETVSVDSTNTPGWAYTCQADYLVYYVPGLEVAYIFRPAYIRRQLERWRRLYRTATAQNDGYRTHGLLVPLDEMERHAHAVVSL